jgi:hypothetical protein
MTVTVTLTDTGQVLGPVTLVYGKEPRMGRVPPAGLLRKTRRTVIRYLGPWIG